jgi:hypothetical protein
MTRDQAIDLLQVMLLDEREPPKLRPESLAARFRPALLDPNASAALRAARLRKQPIVIPPGVGPSRMPAKTSAK